MAWGFAVQDSQGSDGGAGSSAADQECAQHWELVLHIAAWEGVARRRMDGAAAKLSAAKNFPPVTDTSDAAWQTALAHLRMTHEELIATVEKFPRASLAKQVPGKRGAHYDFSFMLHGVAQHAAYHAGQIALLKKM